MKPSHKIISPIHSEIKWNQEISDRLLQKQLALKYLLESQFQQSIIEVRVGFTTLGISWNSNLPYHQVQEIIDHFEELKELPPLSTKVWQIPVCYELEYGRDLEHLAAAKGIAVEAVIKLHSTKLYRLHFYGFLPGFMYLQGLPKELHTPRKSVPDLSVPAGSIAIGGNQTGIYPSISPGGWHLIGQTPISLFDPSINPPVWANPGDQIKFFSIDTTEFKALKQHPTTPIWK